MAGTHISLIGSTLTDTDSFVADADDNEGDITSGYSSTLTGLNASTISNGIFNITNSNIVHLYSDTGEDEFLFEIDEKVSNLGWERLIINDSSGTRLFTLNRSSASFSSSALLNYSRWTWTLTSGTYSPFTLGQTYDFYIRQ